MDHKDPRCEEGHSVPPAAKPGTVTKCRRCRASVRIPGPRSRASETGDLRERLRKATERADLMEGAYVEEYERFRKAWAQLLDAAKDLVDGEDWPK